MHNKIHSHLNRPVSLLCLALFFITGCVIHPAPVVETGSLRIHDIQGCSQQSPYLGLEVEQVPGIITKKSSNGFYLQDDTPDELLCSSEAIFVFTRNYPDGQPGDRVLVDGTVDEFTPGSLEDDNLSLTQLTNINYRIVSRGNQLPKAALIGESGDQVPDRIIENDRFTRFDPNEDGIDFYESLESMLVEVGSGQVVGPRNTYNEVVIIPGELIQENLVSSHGALVQQADDPNPERIMLNLNNENTEKIHLGSHLVDRVIGIMDYDYGNYKIDVFGLAQFSTNTPEITPIVNDPETLLVASYNVENLSILDEDSRFRKVAVDIANMMDSPDIVVLHEVLDDSGVEDDGTVSASITLQRLILQIERLSGIHYSAIDVPPKNNRDGGIDGGNIRSCILYREDTGVRITNVDQNHFLTENPIRIGPDEWPFSVTRKPLMVLFEYKSEQFLVAALHLTSRGADSPLFGNVQPIAKPEEEKRNMQAEIVNQYLSDFHKRHPAVSIIIAGDLNDDPWSDTLKILARNLFVNLAELIPVDERYTYILDGNAIQLDHILFSKESRWDRSFQILHRNSVFDHSQQSSDHDPVIAEFVIP